MAKNYEHLSDMERALIQAKLETGCKLRAIARGLQRSASTISRELKRSGWQGQSTAAPRQRSLFGELDRGDQRRIAVRTSLPMLIGRFLDGFPVENTLG